MSKLAALIYSLTTGFFLGVIAGAWWTGFDWFLLGFLILLALVLWLVTKFFQPGSESSSRLPIYLALILLGASLGLMRFWWSLPSDRQVLARQVGQTITLTGIVSAEPDVRDTNTRLTIKLNDRDFKIITTVPLYPAYEYGDKLELKGKLTKPQDFETDQGRTFDYVNYLAKDDIYYQLSYPKVKLLAQGEGNWLRGKLLGLKGKFLAKINLILPEPESSLLAGLILGVKQSLGEEWLERFRTAGVSHIIVLSGYNVTIIAENLIKFFALLPRVPHVAGWALGGLSIILFAIMTGGGATVVRASIMAIVALFGRATGRLYDATTALLFAAMVMIVINPKILVWDIGFQLSFLATLGLIYLSPIVEPWLERVFPFLRQRKLSRVVVGAGTPLPKQAWRERLRDSFRGILTSTLAAQLAVLPWILYKMGLLSLVALPANLLILLLIPLTMFLGFLAGLLAFISTYLAWPVALLAHALLSYQLLVVKLLASLPLAAISIPYFPWWAALVCYALIGWWVVKYKPKVSPSSSH